jgi:hypothetical protein
LFDEKEKLLFIYLIFEKINLFLKTSGLGLLLLILKWAYTSLKKQFGEAKLSGCLFHLSQIFWRMVQSYGLVNKYNDLPSFRFNLKMILALAFAPEYEIENLSRKLKEYFK